MEEVIIQLTPTEIEIMSACGISVDIVVTGKDAFHADLSEYQANFIARGVEELIEIQERDSGDWMRAKEYRDAKPIFLNKLRRVAIKGIVR